MVAALPSPRYLETPPEFTGRFPVLRASALANQAPTEWLIRDVLPAADLCVVYPQETSATRTGPRFMLQAASICSIEANETTEQKLFPASTASPPL